MPAFCGNAEEARQTATAGPARRRACWILHAGKRTPLDPGETVIGRDPGAGVFIDDPSVSRRHAKIVVTEEDATLEDLGSKNGTHLADRKVEGQAALEDGARIRVGTIALTFRMFLLPDSTQTAVDP